MKENELLENYGQIIESILENAIKEVKSVKAEQIPTQYLLELCLDYYP